jgi:Flp pilus assembly protein TadB
MAQHRHYTNGTSDHVSVGIRASSSSSQQQKSGRVRRLGYRSDKSSRGGLSLIGAVIVFLCLALVVTVLAYYFLSNENTTNDKGLFFFFFGFVWLLRKCEKMRESEIRASVLF